MTGIIGALVFWMACQYLLGGAAPLEGAQAHAGWVIAIAVAVAWGICQWRGDYDTWTDRICHFAALLLMLAAYANWWPELRAATDSVSDVYRWPLVTWLLLGVALPLGMALLGPLESLGILAPERTPDADDYDYDDRD